MTLISFYSYLDKYIHYKNKNLNIYYEIKGNLNNFHNYPHDDEDNLQENNQRSSLPTRHTSTVQRFRITENCLKIC